MTGYIGVRCPVCNKKFNNADDIVVCPTCGAPHHRECYFQKGHCAFQEEHLSGKAWRPPYEPQEHAHEAAEEKTCSACGKTSPSDSIFCYTCGRRFEDAAPSGSRHAQPFMGGVPWMELDQSFYVYGGLDAEDKLGEEITAREMAAYVGNSSGYYLPRFKAIEDGVRMVTVNFSAMLFGFMFFFYRKMYLVGGILLTLFLAGLIPNFLYSRETFPLLADQLGVRELLEAAGIAVAPAESVNRVLAARYYNIGSVVRMANLVVVAFASFLANRLYYEQGIRAVRRIRASYGAADGGAIQSREQYELALARAGGCNKWLVVGLAVGVYAGLMLVVVNFVMR